MPERLSKFLSRTGTASRRKSEQLIVAGRIMVNGLLITEPSYQVIAGQDTVSFDGSVVSIPRHLVYVALYKPAGYLSDLADPRGRKLARTLIDIDTPLFPVGRLDYNSEGLILFTNDGAFANCTMHPRYQTEKEYLVKVSRRLSQEERDRMISGIRIEGDMLKVKSVVAYKYTHRNSWYRIVLTEGKNRMIRKMAESLRHPVLKLRRLRIGGITLTGLQPGQFRHFDPRDVFRNGVNSSLKDSLDASLVFGPVSKVDGSKDNLIDVFKPGR
jgi:23S rRNA pseudouridine2605 synthase